MEVLKRTLKIQHTAVTRAISLLKANIEVAGNISLNEIKVSLQILEDKMAELHKTSAGMIDSMLGSDDASEAEIEKEMEKLDEYKKEFLLVKSSVEDLMTPRVTLNPDVKPENSKVPNVIVTDNRDTYKYPKIELTKFAGSAREWLHFWSQFRKIHDNKKMDTEEKFYYLINSMVPNSKASEFVKSFPPTSENYDKVAATTYKWKFIYVNC